jgi:hypothetical protein
MAKKTEKEQELPNGFDAQEMIAENAEKRTVISYADRVKLEIVQDTRHYKVGQIINPHVVMGEALVKQGIAKKVK